MRVQLNSIIYYIIYILTLISLFFLNNDRTSSNEVILNSILSFFTFIFLFLIVVLFLNKLYRMHKIILVYSFLCITCFIIIFFIRSFVVVHWVYLLISLYIALSKVQLSERVLKITVFLSLCSVLFQLYIFRFFDGRPVLSYIDPNYSGYYIFCLFLFVWYSGFKKTAFCLIFCGLLTLSRNFLLAIILFYVINAVKPLQSIILRFNYALLLLIGYVGLIILSSVYIARFSEYEALNVEVGEKDVTQIMDRSNLDRFTANILFLNDFLTNTDDYYWGTDLETYTNKIFRNSPHNSLLQLILNYGLFFSFFYFLIFAHILRTYRTSSKFASAYVALLMYFLFLGGGIYGIQVIWLSFIYKSSICDHHIAIVNKT